MHQSRVATYKEEVKHVHVLGFSGWTTLFKRLGAPPEHDTYIVTMTDPDANGFQEVLQTSWLL